LLTLESVEIRRHAANVVPKHLNLATVYAVLRLFGYAPCDAQHKVAHPLGLWSEPDVRDAPVLGADHAADEAAIGDIEAGNYRPMDDL
jgi:hypothetical protein